MTSANETTSSNPTVEKLGKAQWLSLGAAFSGWTLDAMDWMMLALALPLIKTSFNCTLPQLGLLATITLLGAAFGGTLMGLLADYFGRVRMLMITMIWYGVFTAACGLAQSYEQLLVLRLLTGFGLGGEWGVGATLVSEYWPDRHRAKATCFVHSGWPAGYGFASVAFMLIAPSYGWRGLFFVGIIPAFIAVWIRTSVPEPKVWVESRKQKALGTPGQPATKFPLATLFSGEYCRLTVVACVLSAGALMAYWGNATWLPSFLAKARGLNIIRTGTFLIILNAGAFLGYQFFGWFADLKGRRLAFGSGLIGSVIVTLIFVAINNEQTLLYFGPIFGFVSYGFFGIFGAFISELFPAKARATGTTLVFNAGRGMSMLSPYIIGAVAQAKGLGFGLGTTAVFNAIGLIALLMLPETVKAGVRLHITDVPTKSATASSK
jgi:MFS family permease